MIDTPQGKFSVTGAEVLAKFNGSAPEEGRAFVIVYFARSEGTGQSQDAEYFKSAPGAGITSPAGAGKMMAGGLEQSKLFVLFDAPKADSGYVLEWKDQNPIQLIHS